LPSACIVAVFGGVALRLLSVRLPSACIVAVFGGVALRLLSVRLPSACIVAVFGGVALRLLSVRLPSVAQKKSPKEKRKAARRCGRAVVGVVIRFMRLRLLSCVRGILCNSPRCVCSFSCVCRCCVWCSLR